MFLKNEYVIKINLKVVVSEYDFNVNFLKLYLMNAIFKHMKTSLIIILKRN